MSLTTTKSKGKLSIDRLRMCLFGLPKVGKTTIMSTFPDTLFLVTEKNHDPFEIYQEEINDWATFKLKVKEIVAGKHQYKRIVIDTGDILYAHCVNYIYEKFDITHASDLKWGKGFELLKTEFAREIIRLFTTPYSIVVLSHTKETEVVSKGGSFTKISATLPTGARAVILPKIPVIGYVHIERVKTAQGTREERRVISFEQSEFVECGNTDNILPNKLVLPRDPKKAYSVFEGYYSGKLKRKEETM